MTDLETNINQAWEDRDQVSASTKGAVRDAVMDALNMLDNGSARVAEQKAQGEWTVNQWLNKAVLLSFRQNDMDANPSGTDYSGH